MKKTYIIPILIAGTLAFVSCKKTLETLPKNSVDATQVVSKGAGVEAILNSAYETMQVATYYGRDLFVVPEVLSDNMRIVSSNSNRFVSESNNLNSAVINIWQNAYLIINKCNGAIKYADLVSDLTDARKKQIKAEALFLRSMAYFDLVKTYSYNPRFSVAAQDKGGVPIVLDYVQNYPGDIKYPSRAATADVYTQIKNDLSTAIGLFQPITDVTYAPKRGNKPAALALLSRVNLYLGEWQACVDNATLALAGGLGTFVDPGATATPQQKSDAYKSIWYSGTSVSPESLFELNYEATETLGSDCLASIYTRYTLGSVPTTGGSGYGDAAPQANLVAAYETGDVRKDLLFAIVKGGESILWNQKYPGQKYASVDNIKLLRVSELYLNRAEANVQLNTAVSLASALVDLNKVRVRANLAPAPVATFAAVFAERRIELAYEGQRWFDLLRTGSAINKSSTTLPASATPTSTIPFTDYRLLSKIPTTEVTNNTNLVQNFNY